MTLSKKKKRIIQAAAIVFGVAAVLVTAYLFNKDAVDNWFRLRFMDEEEYCDMISDKLSDSLRKGLLSVADNAPDLSDGAQMKVSVRASEELVSNAGFTSGFEAHLPGKAILEDGVLSAEFKPDVSAKKRVELTDIGLTVDIPEKRTFVRLPEFDDRTLELSSLYKDQLDSALSSIAPIIDVEGLIGGLAETFGSVGDGEDFLGVIRRSRKSTELIKDVTFWGIGVKEGRDCVCIESKYEISGLDTRVKIYADNKAELLGFDVMVNTGKNRLSCLFDMTKEAPDEKTTFWANYELGLDAVKLLTGTIESYSSENVIICFTAEPGKLLKSLLGSDTYVLSAQIKAQNNTLLLIALELAKNEKDFAGVTAELSALSGKAPERIGRGEVTDINELNIVDYGDIGEITEYVVGKIEELDEQPLRDLVDSYIKQYVNAAAGYEMLREFRENGMLARVVSVLVGKTPLTPAFKPQEPAPEPVPGPAPGTAQPAENPEEEVTADTGEAAPNEETQEGGNDSTTDEPGPSEKEDEAGENEKDKDLPGESEAKTDGGKDTGENVSGGNEAPGLTLEEKKEAFLKQYKYSFPIESDDPKADWGDEVVMDIVPILMGMPYKDAEYKDAYAYLGEQWYGEGLDEKLIGAGIGDVIDVEATLGDDFGAFSGYHGKFRVTITGINKYVRPEWTESFIVGRLGFESLEACEKSL